VGDPEILRGPFPEPLEKPMLHSLGIKPVHDDNFATSELCGTCHTVHLPVLNDGAVIGYTYEQTTYPEWLFSAYRTGTSPNGDLPLGAGDRAASCLDCHMINKDPDGEPFVDKIASIQEYSNFPQAEYNLGPKDIDVKEREGFARHTLVGLNVFLTKMAQQFPDVFGIPTMDPMLTGKGEPSLVRTEQEMLINADGFVADVKVMDVGKSSDTLTATVRIDSKVGHKFPSGVGFRRAILTFEVMDALGNALWTSGGMNGSGVILGADGQPIPGELWWEDDCSARLSPGKPQFQPHHQTITSRDQVQIYQELVVSPAPGVDPMCGDDPAPGGDLTTSFLSICGEVKDNRLLPHGYLRPGGSDQAGRGDRRDGAAGPGSNGAPCRRRSGLCRRRRGHADLRDPAVGHPGNAGHGEGDAELSGDPALLPAGPVLHGGRPGSGPSLLSGGTPEPGRHRGRRLGLRTGRFRQGDDSRLRSRSRHPGPDARVMTLRPAHVISLADHDGRGDG
jgi:hypothetical protein